MAKANYHVPHFGTLLTHNMRLSETLPRYPHLVGKRIALPHIESMEMISKSCWRPNTSLSLLRTQKLNELKYTLLCLRETLRLHSPVPMTSRVALEDDVIDGVTIPAGTKVFVAIQVWTRGCGDCARGVALSCSPHDRTLVLSFLPAQCWWLCFPSTSSKERAQALAPPKACRVFSTRIGGAQRPGSVEGAAFVPA